MEIRFHPECFDELAQHLSAPPATPKDRKYLWAVLDMVEQFGQMLVAVRQVDDRAPALLLCELGFDNTYFLYVSWRRGGTELRVLSCWRRPLLEGCSEDVALRRATERNYPWRQR